MFKRKLLAFLLSLGIGLLGAFVSPVKLDASGIGQLGVNGMNTTAGYAGLVSTSVIQAGETVTFYLEKPDGETITFVKENKKNGSLVAEIDARHLEEAGVYVITAKTADAISEQCPFIVRAASIDPSKSSLYVENREAAVHDTGRIIATIQDKFGNPISDHKLRLISSRNDQINTPYHLDGISDNEGLVVFEARSNDAGQSIFSLIDVTSGSVLPGKARLSFNPVYYGWGGNPFSVRGVYADSADYFIVREVPDRVVAGSPFSVTVEAVDNNTQTIDDYTGTIQFSATDLQADLPADYTFVRSDAGEKKFNLAVTFNTVGQQRLVVTDTEHQSMKGNIEISVVSSGASQPASSSVDESPVITSPQNDFVTKGDNVVITGTTVPLVTISIFDGLQKIGDMQSNPQGEFSYDARTLSEGAHDFTIAATSADGRITTSEPVRVIVDKTAATIKVLRFEPEKPKAGDSMIALLQSESDLSLSRIELDKRVIELSPAQDIGAGWYKASFNAPSNAGNYPVKVDISDKVGNRASFDSYKTLTIETTDLASGAPSHPAASAATIQLAAQRDGVKILFSWQKTEDSSVTGYNLFQSVSPSGGLTKANALPITSNSYLLDQQANPETRYYKVVGINNSGNEVIVSDIIKVAGYTADTGASTGASVTLPLPTIGQSPETGPETWLIVIFAAILGITVLIARGMRLN